MGKRNEEILRLMKENRVGEKNFNHQGCLMKIIEYNNNRNVIIEFQDEYKVKFCTTYNNFQKGNVKNPYYPMVLNVGILGVKYPSKINGKNIEEYIAWENMLKRCFDKDFKNKRPTYNDVTCCEEWLKYENFYEWLHSQENFKKWLNGDRWCLDKDILFKGNKTYSPDTCCLVPNSINTLFVKCNKVRGDLPIGVIKDKRCCSFAARCMNPITCKREYLGSYSTPYYAFLAYKKYKEDLIKQVAKIEYDNGNITEECYNAMMNYQVEITD